MSVFHLKLNQSYRYGVEAKDVDFLYDNSKYFVPRLFFQELTEDSNIKSKKKKIIVYYKYVM